ncbi:hypothetical protein ACQ4PT_001383 [Festuca glaucescens]
MARPRTKHATIFIAFVPARADVVAEGRAAAAANHNKDIDVMVKVAGQLCAVYCELLSSSACRIQQPTNSTTRPAQDPTRGRPGSRRWRRLRRRHGHHLLLLPPPPRAHSAPAQRPSSPSSSSAVLAVTALLRASHRYGDLAPPAFAAARAAARNQTIAQRKILLDPSFTPRLPRQSALSLSLAQRNALPPRNADRFPSLPDGHLKIVLYVHNRPRYLRLVVDSLSRVDGIDEALLIVSHDGYFPEMDEIVKGITFCQVKQIFAPYSPHLFPDSFPGVTPGGLPGQGEGCREEVPGQPGPVRQPPRSQDRVAEAPLVVDDEHRVGWAGGDQGLR